MILTLTMRKLLLSGPPIPCPLHSCTKKLLNCPGELAQNENGCDLCECADTGRYYSYLKNCL